MEPRDFDFDKLLDLSRFDYSQWMQRAAGDDEAGSAAIHTLMSTYDIFHQLRNCAVEDAGAASMATFPREQRSYCSSHGLFDTPRMNDLTFLDHSFDNGYGQNCASVDAGRLVTESASEMMYDQREEELLGLNDGRMASTDTYEITCDNEDYIADNFAAEGAGLNEHARPRRRGGRRHRSNMMKRPMALAEIILELLDIEKRENALRCLSGHLIERRETDDRFYRTAGYQLYFSCSTLAILVQEVISAYARIYMGDLNVRGSKRLANVLTCFQSIASSDETRIPFVRARIPNLLQPFILSTFTEEVYENIRAISLSVIELTCKGFEREVIHWALESDIVQDCLHAIEIGSRLSKLIAMSILESILHDELALGVICRPDCNLAMDIVKMLSYLAALLGVVQDFSRRLIFQVVRCYTLLCQHPRALELVKDNFPEQLLDHTFHELKKVYPLFRILLHQLLLCIGKIDTYLPQVSPSDSEALTTPSTTSQVLGKENRSSESSLNKPSTQTPKSSSDRPSLKTSRSVQGESPLRPLDLHKEDWHRLPDTFHYVQLEPNFD